MRGLDITGGQSRNSQRYAGRARGSRTQVDGSLDLTTAAIAKYWLTETEWQIVDDCLQLHGGYGYINDYPIARMFRNSRVQRIYGGSNEIMKMLIARSL